MKTKLGLLEREFPLVLPEFDIPTLTEWRGSDYSFFIDFGSVEIDAYSEDELKKITSDVDRIHGGEIQFFSHQWLAVSDWFTHPVTGYVYPKKHFTQIKDFSESNGDIKFAWEKARFSWVYTLIRYQKQTGENQSEFIFTEIERFIDENPLNIGPQYKCSQEMSLRVFNWSFALFFYRDDAFLTDELFQKIITSIYGHFHHIYHNIDFSRIAVRNNHAITETLGLYLISKWYPFLPNSNKWGSKGKAWFEEEIAYQLYPDGGFLQYSHNYHRVVVQLLTWAILNEKGNEEGFKSIVKERALKTFEYLSVLAQEKTGWLPNYGQNDGALFFPLNMNHYRDFRPQLNALGMALGKPTEDSFEDNSWYGLKLVGDTESLSETGLFAYETYGQYVFKDVHSLTVINNPKYINRPAQSDQLHLDIHVNGKNVLFDPGTYKYNTEKKYVDFFFGTGGHNTLQIGNANQMLKGQRFVWYNWIIETNNKSWEDDANFYYSGTFNGFMEETGGVTVSRKVTKRKQALRWEVEDRVEGDLKSYQMNLHWNILPEFMDSIVFECVNENGGDVKVSDREGWVAPYYGVKKEFNQKGFSSQGNYIKTVIQIDENTINSSIFS